MSRGDDPMTDSPRREPGTYRTEGGGIEVIVDVPESASWVEDQWPDEVAFIRDQAAQAARAEIAEKVRGLPLDPKFTGQVQLGFERMRAAVLRLIEGGSDDR